MMWWYPCPRKRTIAVVYLQVEGSRPSMHQSDGYERGGITCPLLSGKSLMAKEQIVHRFMKHLGLTQHAVMRTTQKHYKETKSESKDFIAMIRESITNNKDDILNMDQTPIAYSFHSRKTLEKKGTKSIQVRASMMDTKHVTAAVTITASGKMLLAFMVFKRAPNGCIAKQEFVSYTTGRKYAGQPKVWMDKTLMCAWIDAVIKPYKDENDARDQGRPPLLTD